MPFLILRNCLIRGFFWFDHFVEARAEKFNKISLVFWEIWRHQKGHLKINWPLKPTAIPSRYLSYDPSEAYSDLDGSFQGNLLRSIDNF